MRPVGDRLLVRTTPIDSLRSPGGILYADTVAARVAPQQGYVVATGSKVGKRLQEGQTILFGLGVGEDVLLQGAPHVIIREQDVVCRLS